MAEDTPEAVVTAEPEVLVVRRPLWQRVVKWTGIALAGLALAVGALVLGINTQPGRRFVADRIAALTLGSGLNFRIGRIDGSLYGAMVLRDVQVRDIKGVFATSREIRMDWRPFAYLNNRVDIRSATSPEVKLLRMPALKASGDPNAPLLPDLNIDIGRLDVARIDIAKEVDGRARYLGRLAGKAHLADGRAQMVLDGATLTGPGVPGGDKLALTLDATPDKNRFDIDMKLDAPAKGLVAGLAGLEAPLGLTVNGKGDWARWQGKALGTLGGAQLANLDLIATNGRFQLRGPLHPGVWLKGPVERLASPQLDLDLDAKWADRVADGVVKLHSDALSVEAKGKIDLGHNRFDDFKVDGILLKAGAIAPNLVGRSVRASLALDGAFNRPVVDYKLSAGAIGFGETVAEQLYAEGRAQVDANRILVPVRARAKRVSGLNAAAGGLVTNLTVNGDLAISGQQVLSDNLRIRSDKIDATAIIAADVGKGRYTGALKGRVNDYQIDGVGIVDLRTDAELYAAPGGGWGIKGHIAGNSRKIFSDGAREFLGGNAVASARLVLDPKGVISISDVKMKAPKFRVLRGSGRYDPAGPILINADAVSDDYGPLTARVTGTLNAPVVLLKAAKPGLGIGLANLEAQVRGRGNAWAVLARGDTDYGPFNADVLVRTGNRLAIDINSGRFAGMDITGKVAQTAAGPFEGELAFNGSGVVGRAALSAQGKLQRADVKATASNAKIPGAAGLTIGRALIDGNIVLADTPEINGDVQVANLRQGNFVLKTGRAKIAYAGGNGTAQLFANGSTGVPFQIAANAKLAPDDWLVAVQGQGSGIGFKTAQPARIERRDGVYHLLPTKLDFDKGSARIAGSYGKGMVLQARLDSLDISVVNAFVPDLGIGGTATGSLDFAQTSPEAFPSADARLEISDFTRASLASVSTPVNVSFVGKLLPNGGDARALIRRGNTTIGRVIATLSPLGPDAGSWTERMFAAPLSGGIRYNGPAAVPFSLAGLSGQQLDGPIGIAADFSGKVEAPQLAGVVRASNLTYENENFGTRLTGMQIDGTFSNDEFLLNSLTARAGEGTVKAQGKVSLSSANGYPIAITADLDNARLARSDALGATATGRITITKNPQVSRIDGRLTVPEAHYQIIRQGAAEVPELTGVRRKNPNGQEDTPAQVIRRSFGDFDLNLRINADNRLFVNGMGLESEWRAQVTVRGTTLAPDVRGTMEIVRGTYSFASRRFDISRGTIRFQGSTLTNPSVDIQASTTAEGITAILTVSGTAQQPQIAFSSTPTLPQEEVLARLFFGTNVTNLSATEAIQLAAALQSLSSTGGGLNPLGQLKSATGIDRLRILGADDVTGRGMALAAGKYLTDDIYVEIITDARGFTATQLEISLSRTLSLLSQAGSFGGSSVSLKYSRDY
ncbi:translocation/assembly module TamB domain-containing protein [Sphingomonas sp. NIBR02145]|uniref:translocation/assembly module TamB domain-containing protein n=1 Tax=Sphingomonas sp. NIBR02145 TaxID=3014784 RepID=UPI0022B4E0DB|nr:translocation/assembly module TamB domain-containing protein [Sphingomonas sp. NIBR02145]WHU04075.1 translocation/assembly module TamB domain-containing protein [Sphingomonas sp. NIBR02145]